jgi:hypothetical protein
MGPVVSEGIKRNLFLVKFTQRAWDRIFPPSQRRAANPVGISEENESALKKFLGWAQSATVILLPIKEDAAFEPRRELSSCSISPDNFLPHDGHPSEAG